MKNKKLILWIVAIILFFSFAASTCGDDNNSTDPVTSFVSGSLEEISTTSYFDNFSSENGDLSESYIYSVLTTTTGNSNKLINTHTHIENTLVDNIPKFDNKPYIKLNNNKPDFTLSDYSVKSFEIYSDLDAKGRCGAAFACIGRDIMPTEERGEIGQIKPSGWHTVKYDVVDGKYLYNRCHLIGYQLTGENANTKNLITGTRYLNVEGMLPFENMVADYVTETGNHVLYRVTPVFEENNLLASGVQIEGYSVEDNGEGICFNIYCYNAQPGVTIDYSNGDSKLTYADTISTTKRKEIIPNKSSNTTPKQDVPKTTSTPAAHGTDYVVNTNTGKFHYPHCSSADNIKPQNKWEFVGTRNKLINDGYVPCKRCNP